MHERSPSRLGVLALAWLAACSSGARPASSVATSPSTAPRAPTPATASAMSIEDARASVLRSSDASPLDRALLACELLLDGASFVGPSSPRRPDVPDATWRLLHEPVEQYRDGRRELVFFALVDDAITEIHLDASTAELEAIPLAVIAATASEPSCEAPTHCGCFSECVEVVRLGPDGPDARYRTLGPGAGLVLHRAPQCYEGSCARVCDAPGHCIDALSSRDETCTGACVPSEAGFHCARGPSGCERVAH